jgi:hypothetical protein
MLATHLHPIGPDLPRAPHAGVDDGCRTAPVGRPFGHCDQLPGLNRKQRQCDLTDALDRQSRGQKLHPSGSMEIARPPDRAQQIAQFFADVRHQH